MEAFKADLRNILPTQLYISERKYQTCSALFEKNGFDDYPPIPVRRIGNDLFFTDGHTRALLLWQNGIRDATVYYDTDEMDWIMYLVDLEWCRDRGIRTIAGLKDRIVDARSYQEKWIDRCSESHDLLAEDPIRDLKVEFETDDERKSAICAEVLGSLPQWFGIGSAVLEYVEKVRELAFVTVQLYGKTIGFCAVKINYGINADLYVLGVFEEFHRKGIGARMVDFVQSYCRKNKIRYMSVKTLSERHPDENYSNTRKFYKRCGFIPFEELPTLWGADNPCLCMIKEVD